VISLGVIFQAAGFIKLLVVANYFGAGPVLDGYYLGLVIPTFLTGIAATLLQAGFVPRYIAANARKDGAAARLLRNACLSWTFAILTAIPALLCVLENPISALLWRGIDPTIAGALHSSFVPLIWTTPLTGLAQGIALLLNAEGKFGAAAGAPIGNSIVGSLTIFLLRAHGIDALIISSYAGLLLQLLILWFALHRLRLTLGPDLSLPKALPSLVMAVGLPVLVSGALGSCVPAFLQTIAARAGPGAVSVFGYANLLHNALVQTVTMSVSVVLLPHFSQIVAEQRHDELRATLNTVFAATVLFSMAGIAFIAATGSSAVGILLQRGRFTSTDADLVANVWLAFTTGLLGVTWGIFLVRLFQATQQMWLVAKVSAVSVAANVLLAFVLMPAFGVTGIAIANSFAYTVTMSIFHVNASRAFGRFIDRDTVRFAMYAMVANSVACVLARLLNRSEEGVNLVVLVGQGLVVVSANLLIVHKRPLGLSLRGLMKRQLLTSRG